MELSIVIVGETVEEYSRDSDPVMMGSRSFLHVDM